jgi:hypothetical protein
MCHHVSFQSKVIDWQAWIEDGAVPLVRKAVIDFKTEQGSPRWMVLLNKWDLVTPLPDFVFRFEPPPGAIVPTLPPGSTATTVNGQTYFVYNGKTYYRPVLANGATGYQVVQF